MTVFGMMFERARAEGFPLWSGANLPGQALAGNPADPCNNVAWVTFLLTKLTEKHEKPAINRWAISSVANFIANALTPRPSRHIVGSNERNPMRVVGTGGRRAPATQTPAVSAPAPIPRVADHGGCRAGPANHRLAQLP